MRLQNLAVSRAAMRAAANAVDLEPELPDPQGLQQLPKQHDHLNIVPRLGAADALDSKLMKLAVASLLRSLGAKHRAMIKQSGYRVMRAEFVFDPGAHHTGGSLRAQDKIALAAVGKAKHLFPDYIRLFADTVDKEFRRLKNRRADLGIAIAQSQIRHRLLGEAPERRPENFFAKGVGQYIICSLDFLYGCHENSFMLL